MRARQAAPIYFISTLIKRKLIATSLIMLQAAFDDVNGKTQKNKTQRLRGSESSTWMFRRQHTPLMMKINRLFLHKSTMGKRRRRYNTVIEGSGEGVMMLWLFVVIWYVFLK